MSGVIEPYDPNVVYISCKKCGNTILQVKSDPQPVIYECHKCKDMKMLPTPYYESVMNRSDKGCCGMYSCGHRHKTADAARKCPWDKSASWRQIWLVDAEPEKDRYADGIDRLIYEDHRAWNAKEKRYSNRRY